VYRKDRRMPITSTVWMAEYSTGRSLWATKPRMMLEKVAIATAFRRAFPTDFGGMPYTNDELPEHMTGADKLEQQGYTEVQQAAPVAQVEQPKAAKTQDEKDANWIAMCDELRERNPEIFDNYLKQHNAACVLTKREDLREKLREVLTNAAQRQEILRNARALAAQNHDATIYPKKVRGWLQAAIDRQGSAQ
jgi:hypothetical protein